MNEQSFDNHWHTMDPQEALKRLDVSDLGAVFRFVNDRLNRASQDRRNGATQKAPKTISDDPFKSVFFASFF